MVCDPHTNFVGTDGTSRTISNENDRALLVHLRKLSDLIVTDAATASAEKYRASKWAPIEVWSRSGNFRTVAATPGTAEHMSLATHQIDDLQEAVNLRLAKCPTLLFETGPSLSKALGKLRLIDELCLTVTHCASIEQAEQSIELAKSKLELGYLVTTTAVALEGSVFARLTR
jgi:riboflavin biosynthesis pyrimidine reductase